MKAHLAVRWLMLFLMGIYSLGPAPLWANPTGGTVVSGSATITNNGNTLTVNQATTRAIINWQSFSISSGQTTYISQPNSASAELDRVTGGSMSSLLGSLGSNGQVYLINPSGIVFGQGFQLNTAGFLASTLDVNNSAFMSGGSLEFTGNSTAAITNNGSLTTTAGDVFLFATQVTNNGTINAKGTAGLAAGSDILLAPSGGQRVFIQAGSQPGTVVNHGTVQAVAAELKAVGGNAGALAINNTGTVRATGVANVGGHIWLTATNGSISNSGSLVAKDSQGNGGTIHVKATSNNPSATPATVTNSGTIDASGTATASSVGGAVVVTGDNVHLASTSVVNVSGNAGGGTAYIGGGPHGADAKVSNAQTTTVDQGSQVNASALLSGNGGNVVVWSNDDTEYFGDITAQGGSLAGNGGNVEVSGGYLNFQGGVNTLAPHGTSGNLLLDPYAIVISNSDNGAYTTTGTTTYAPNATPSSISWATLEGALGTGNVTVTTDGTGNGSVVGNITITATPTTQLNTGHSLTLTADNDTAGGDTGTGAILFNDGVSVVNTGSGALNLNAGSGGVQFGVDAGATGAALNFAGPVTINTPGGVTENGSASITAGTLYLEGGGTASLANSNNVGKLSTAGTSYNGSIALNNGANNLTVGDGANGIDTSTGNGAVSLTTTGSLTLNQGINAGSGTVTLSSSSGVTENNTAAITGGTLYLEGGGTASLANSNDVTELSTTATSYNGAITFNNGANNLTVGDGANGINTSTGNGAVSLTTTGSLTLNQGISAGTGTVTLDNGGALTQSSAITGGSLVLDGTGSVTLTTAGNNFANLTINAVSQTGTSTLTYLGTTVPQFSVTETATGGINFADGQSATDSAAGSTLTLDAGTGGVTFGDASATGTFVNFPGSVTISTTGGVTENGAASITTGILYLEGTGTAGLANSNDVTELSTTAATYGGSITLNNGANNLTVGDGTNGVKTNNTAVSLTTTGTLALNQAINAGSGTVTLDNGGTASGSGLITANTLNLEGAGAVGTGTGGRVNTAVTTLAVDSATGSVYINQTGALDLQGTGASAGGTGATILDILGSAGLTFTGMLNLTPASDAVLRFASGTITGQGGSTDLSFGPGSGTAFTGTGTVELLAGTGIVNIQDAGNGVDLAFNNATSGNVNINSYGGTTGTTIETTGNVAAVSNVNGTISVYGRSPLAVNSSMTATSITLQTLDDQAGAINNITVGGAGAVTLDGTGSGIALEAGNSVLIDNSSTIEATGAGGKVFLGAQFGQSGAGAPILNDGIGNINLGSGTISSSSGSVELYITNTSAPAVTTVATISQTGGAIDASTGLQIIGAAADGVTTTLTAGSNAVGTIAISSNGSVSYTDSAAGGLTVGAVTGTTGTTTGIALTAVTGSSSLTLQSAGLLDLINSINTSSSGGNISLTSVGLTQAAASTVNAGTGQVAINAGAGAINMAGTVDSGNTGNSTTTPTSAAIYITNSSGGIVLGNINQSSAAGELYVASAGAISQTEVAGNDTSIDSAGTAVFATTLANAGDVTLVSSATGLNFQTTVGPTPPPPQTGYVANGTVVGGNLNITVGGGSVTDTNLGAQNPGGDGLGVFVAGNVSVTGGTLNLTDPDDTYSSSSAGGTTIHQAGVINLGSTATPISNPITGNLTVVSMATGAAFTNGSSGYAGTAAITLNGTGNSFGNVAVHTASNPLTVYTTASPAQTGITQSSVINMTTAASTATFITQNSSANNTTANPGDTFAGSIVLTNTGNTFGTGGVAFDVQQTATPDTLGNVSLVSVDSETIISPNGTIPSTAFGNLSITTLNNGTTISQSATGAANAIDVGGTSSFTAGNNGTITLNNTGNGLAGDVSLSATGGGGSASVINNPTLTLDIINIGGTGLSAESTTGNVAEDPTSNNFTITGSSTFTTLASNATITLENNSAFLNEIGTLGGASVSLDTVGASGNATIENGINTTFGASTVGGTLTAGIVGGPIEGTIRQSGNISAAELVVNAEGTINLDNGTQQNTIPELGNINANGNDFYFYNTTGLTQAAATKISAANIEVEGTGPFVLTNNNAVTGNFAANVTGAGSSIAFNDGSALTVGTVNAVSGITVLTGENVFLESNGALTLNEPISGAGSTAAGQVALDVLTGGISQANNGSIDAGQLLLLGGSGNYTLTSSGNTIATLAGAITAVATNTIDFRDSTSYAIGDLTEWITPPGTVANGFSFGSGTLELEAGSGNTVSENAGAVLSGSKLQLGGATASTANYNLGQANNNANLVTSLAANVNGTINYQNAQALTVGNLVTTGIASGGNNVTLTTTTGGIAIANSITASGAVVTLNSAAGVSGNASPAVTAGSLVLEGAGNVADTYTSPSSATPLNTQVSTLTLSQTTSGNVYISNNQGLAVGGTVNGAGNTTVATTTGDISIAATGLSSGTGVLTLDALAGNIDGANTGIISMGTGGSLALLATQSIGTSGQPNAVQTSGSYNFAAKGTNGVYLNNTGGTVTINNVTPSGGYISVPPVGGPVNGVNSSSGAIEIRSSFGDGVTPGLDINSTVTTGGAGGGVITIQGGVVNNDGPNNIKAGTGNILLNGGLQDVTITGAYSFSGPVVFSASRDIILDNGSITTTGGGNITLLADESGTPQGIGVGGIVFAGDSFVNSSGSVIMNASDLFTAAFPYGNLTGNAIVLESTSEESGTPVPQITATGNVIFNVRATRTGAVVEDTGNASDLAVQAGDVAFVGSGQVGTLALPIVTQVNGVALNKPETVANNVFLSNPASGILDFINATTLGSFQTDAASPPNTYTFTAADVAGDITVSTGTGVGSINGNIDEDTGAGITALSLTATNGNGGIVLTNDTNLVQNFGVISAVSPGSVFNYTGGINLTLNGAITAASSISINNNTFDINQDSVLGRQNPTITSNGSASTITFTSGTFELSANITAGASASPPNGTVIFQNSGTLTAEPDSFFAATTYPVVSGGIIGFGSTGNVAPLGATIDTDRLQIATSSVAFSKTAGNIYLLQNVGGGITLGNDVNVNGGTAAWNSMTGTLDIKATDPTAIVDISDGLSSGVTIGQLNLYLADGGVDLTNEANLGVNNISAFGPITVLNQDVADGFFLYSGYNGSSVTTLQLNGPINTVGNVSINMGTTSKNIVQNTGAPINASAVSSGSGSITFGFDTGTFNDVIGNPTTALNGNTPQANVGTTYFTNTDAVAFYNGGTLTLNRNTNADTSPGGANVFAEDSVTEYDEHGGNALVSLGSDITTYGTSTGTPAAGITFQSKVVLIPPTTSPNPPVTTPIVLTADNNFATGGGITFDQTLNGTVADQQNLTAIARNGNITFTGVIGGSVHPGNIVAASNGTTSFGTSSSIITVNANSVTTQGSTEVASPSVIAGNTSLYATTVTTDGWNNAIAGITGGQVYGNSTVLENVSTPTTGNITLTANDVAADPDNNPAAPAGNNIYFLNTLNGATSGADNLTLTPGATPNIGNIGFVGAVGGSVRLGNVTITTANNVDVNRTQAGFTGSGGFTAETLTQLASTVAGVTTFGLAIAETGSYPGEGAIDLAGSIAPGAPLTAPTHYPGNDTLPTADALYINGNTVTFNAGASVNTSFSATPNSAGVVILNAGTLTMVQGSDMGFNANASTTPGLAGQFLQLGAGPVVMGNDITTQGYATYFTGAVTFDPTTAPVASTTFPATPPQFINSSLINTTGSGKAAGADIVFGNTVNGQTTDLNNVTLNAGTGTSGVGGSIYFYGNVGATTPLGDLVIADANNVKDNTFSIESKTLYQAAGSGTTTITGLVIADSNAFNQTYTPSAMLTPTSAAASIQLPPSTGAGTGGGVQMNTQYIDIADNVTADSAGEISLNAEGFANGTAPTGPLSNPYAALLIEKNAVSGNGSVVTANGGGNIYLTTSSASGADVIINGGSEVQTTGAGTGAITINSSDDVVLDGIGGVTEGYISTVNGNISITANNDLLEPAGGPPDNANGVVIQASNDAAGVLVSANGTLQITANTNQGELEILGGTSGAGSFATVESTGNQTIQVAGGPNTLNAPATSPKSALTAVVVEGGSGTTAANATAKLLTTTTTANQSITAATGDVVVQGGTVNGATATISSDSSTASAQLIQVNSGNLFVEAGEAVAGAAANISADTAGATQTINVVATSLTTGNITVQAGGGNALISNGQANDDTKTQAITAGQNITVKGSNTATLSGNGQILAGGAQTIIAAQNVGASPLPSSSSILVQGGTSASSTATIQSFGTTTTQAVETINAGNITVQGGDGTGAPSNASIQASNAAQNITVVNGFLHILADNNFASAGNAQVEDTNATGVQTVNVTNGGIQVVGGLGSDTADLQASGTGSQQAIHLITVGDFDVYSGTGASANATVIANGLNNGSVDAQSIIVDSGNFNIVSSQAAPTANSNTVAQVEVSNAALGNATQFVQVGEAGAGTISLTGGLGTGANNQAILSSNGFGTATPPLGGISQSVSAESGITITGGGVNAGGAADLAEILASGSNSQQLVQVVGAGNLTLQGGAGPSASGSIIADGINGPSFVPAIGADAAQQILVDNGKLNLTGGTDPTAAGDANIDLLNLGLAGQYVNASGTAGNGTITLLGDTLASPGANNFARIFSQGFNAAVGVAQSITAQSGISLTGGTGTASTAYFRTSGLDSTQLVTATTGNIAVTGGNGSTSPAYIENDGLQQTLLVSSGNLTVTGDLNAASTGSYAGILTTNAASNQMINVVGNGTTTGNITVTGGLGSGDYGSITAANTQTIGGPISAAPTPISGTVTVQGGGGGAKKGDYAAITAVAAQQITITGNLDIYGSDNITTPETALANDDYALVYGHSTQTIGVTGGIEIEGDQGSSSAAHGNFTSLGAGIVADDNQSVTASTTGIYIQGGTLAGSAAGIDETAVSDASATQTLSSTGLTTIGATHYGIDLEGGTAGDGDEALIYSGNTGTASPGVTQSIDSVTGGINLSGNGASSGDGATIKQNFGDVGSLGAGIVATNTQLITVDANGGLTLTGGTVTGSAAAIDEVASPVTGALQTLTIHGTNTALAGISLNGGSAGAPGNEALIYSGNSTSLPGVNTQNITAVNGGILLNGNAASSAKFGDVDSIGAGIVATNTQLITVDVGGLALFGGSVAGSAAVIDDQAKTDTAATQTLSIAGTVTGNPAYGIIVEGGTAANGDEALIYSGNSTSAPAVNTQNITSSTGGIYIFGNGASSGEGSIAQGFGNFNSIGAGIVATNTQLITTSAATSGGSGLTVVGGSVKGSAAVIDDVANTDKAATQTLNISGTTLTNNSYGIVLEGGTAGNGDEAMIYSGNTTSAPAVSTQDITSFTGGIYIDAKAASSGGVQTFGDVGSFGAGILADNTQLITADAGGLTLFGGSHAGGAAAIDEVAVDTAATQTINASGTTFTNPAYGILLQGGTAGSGDEALIYSNNTTGSAVAQSIEAFNAGIDLNGNGANSTFTVTTSEISPSTYEIGAGILANNYQSVTAAAGDIQLQGGTNADNAIASAVIGMLSKTATQQVTVSLGNLNINAGNDSDGANFGSAAGIVSYGVDGSSLAQTITVHGDITLTASQDNNGGTIRDAFIDLFANETVDQTGATQSITSQTGYIALLAGQSTSFGDWAYIGSSGAQTILAQGASPSTIAGNPFGSDMLGLGLDAGNGNSDYAIVHADRAQMITATTGDVQVLAGNPPAGSGNDLAAIFTTGADGAAAPQTISVQNGNLIVNGESTGVNVPNLDLETQYYVGAAAIDSAGVQTITVDGTPTAAGNVTVTGGSGQGGAANIQSLNTQFIGTVGNAVAGTITVQGGGTGFGAYGAVSSSLAQTIHVTGNLIVEGSSTATGAFNDDYAAVTTLQNQTITVGGFMSVLAQKGSSDGSLNSPPLNPGPLALAGVPTGLGAAVMAFNQQTGGSQDITVAGGNLTVEGGSGGIGNTAALIGQENSTSDQKILVTDASPAGNILVEGGSDTNGYAQIDSKDTQEIGTVASPITGSVTVEGGGTQANSGAYGAITATSAQTVEVTGNLNVLGSMSATASNGGNDQNDYGLIYTPSTQSITVGTGLTVNANYATSNLASLSLTTSEGRTYAIGAGIEAGSQQTITVTTGNADISGGPANGASALIAMTSHTATQTLNVDNGNLALAGGSGSNLAAAGILSFGVDGATPAQHITVLGGSLSLAADQSSTSASDMSDAFIDLFASQLANQAGATQTISVGQAANPGYISLLGGGIDTGNDWAYISSSGLQTITVQGASPTTIPGNPFGSDTLGLGVAAGPGGFAYALVHADRTQQITATTGDIQVLGSNPPPGSGNGLAAIFTTGADGAVAPQTLSVANGNLIVNGETTGLSISTLDGESQYFVGAAAIDSAGVQTITVDGTPTAAGNVTVTGGTGQSGAANIESLGTQFIGTAGNAVSGTITVQGGGPGLGAYGAITSSGAQTIHVTGNLLVDGSTTTGGGLNDDYAVVGTQQSQSITVGGFMQVLAQHGSSDSNLNSPPLNPGPLANASFATGLGAVVVAMNQQTGGFQDITVAGGNLTVEGGSNSVGDTAAVIEQGNNTSDQKILLTDAVTPANLIVEGGSDYVAYAQIDSKDTQEIGTVASPITGSVTVEGGGNGGNAGSYAAITSEATTAALPSDQSFNVTGGVDVFGTTAANVNSGNDDYALIQSSFTQALTVGGNLDISANSGSSSGAVGPLAIANLGAAVIANNTQTVGVGTVSPTGILSVLGGTTSGSGATLLQNTAGNAQNIQVLGKNAVTGDSVDVTATGTGANAGASIVSAGSQALSPVAGNVNLTASNGQTAKITAATTQTINSTGGAIDMSGTGGGAALITAVHTVLTMGGSGASTWTGNSVVGTDGVTQYVEFVNNGALTIVNPPAVDVFADAGAGEIEFDGTGMIGSASQSLNTKTENMKFDQGGESVYVNENVDPVALQGTVGTLALTTTGTAAGADAVTNGAALSANMVSITTSDGGINLTNAGNAIAAFGTINAQGAGAEFDYTGTTSVALDGPVTTVGNVDVNVGANTITFNNGNITSTAGTQTYASNVVLGANSTLQAGAVNTDTEAIGFAGTVTGGGVNSLAIQGGDATFNKGAGTIVSPLFNLIFAAGTMANLPSDLTATVAGATTLADPIMVLNNSLLNSGTLNLTGAGPTTLVVDNGTPGPGPGVFSGGTMVVTTPADLVIYGANPAGVTGSAVPSVQVFSAWNGGPVLLKSYALDTVFFKAQKVTTIIPFPELTTFILSNVANGLYPGYQVGGDAGNLGANGANGENGNGANGENGAQNPGTLAGAQQYPFVSVIEVSGYGPGSDDNGGEVWISSGSGYFAYGSSEEFNAGPNAALYPPDEKHFPKKLKHKPMPGMVPQAGGAGSGR